VYWQIADRSAQQVFSRGLLVWCAARLAQTFHLPAVTVSREAPLRPSHLFQVPAAAAMIDQGIATDVPRCLRVRATDGPDDLTCVIEHRHVARFSVPNETGPGLTHFDEAVGSARVEGCIAGQRIAEGFRIVTEHNRATA
jgi:hypothetical protein